MFIHNTKPRLTTIVSRKGTLRLMPGVNEVSQETWDKVKDHPHLKRLLAAGHVAVPKPVGGEGATTVKSDGGEVRPADGLAGFSNKEAMRLIGETVDQALLSKWLETETRRNVREAIDKQIEKLKS